ncbi:MAG TPA: sodium:solute symporter, partial [Amycolatopsis sp.]|nr:sodium:solute symporter [Amycolatopsis sp.]
PTVAISLYTRWFHRWGLIAGWVVGIGWGLVMLYNIPNAATGKAHFGGSALKLGDLSIFGWHPLSGSQLQIYVGFVALIANLLVAVIFTVIARQLKVFNGTDDTEAEDYHADEHDKDLREIGVH